MLSGQLGLQAHREGDFDADIISCGQVVGMINSLKSVKEVMDEIVDGAHEIYQRIG